MRGLFFTEDLSETGRKKVFVLILQFFTGQPQ